jgi:hypothetical protein
VCSGVCFATPQSVSVHPPGVLHDSFDAFLWEVFTTKPWFEKGKLQYLGEVATPWPAFVFVTKETEAVPAGEAADRAYYNQTTLEPETELAAAATSAAAMKEIKLDEIKNKLFPALREGVDVFLAEAQPLDQHGRPWAKPVGGDATAAEVGAITAPTPTPTPATAAAALNSPTVQRIVREFKHTPEDALLWLSRNRWVEMMICFTSYALLWFMKTFTGCDSCCFVVCHCPNCEHKRI